MSNYPDDIRSFDHKPSSPFSPEWERDHEDLVCRGCEEHEDGCRCEEPAGPTPSQYVKSQGVRSLTEVSQLTGVSLQTLSNWHRDKPSLFKVVVAGCKALEGVSDAFIKRKQAEAVEVILDFGTHETVCGEGISTEEIADYAQRLRQQADKIEIKESVK